MLQWPEAGGGPVWSHRARAGSHRRQALGLTTRAPAAFKTPAPGLRHSPLPATLTKPAAPGEDDLAAVQV